MKNGINDTILGRGYEQVTMFTGNGSSWFRYRLVDRM